MEFVVGFGGALLSASVQPLMERITSDVLNFFAPREINIHADLKALKMKLAEINNLLKDAEDTQTTSDDAEKKWPAELRGLIYDMEDVLDEFNTEAFKGNVMEDSFVFKNNMESRIKDITERLRRIDVCQAPTLNLRKFAKETTSNQLKQRETTAVVEKSYIYGRNDEKEAIVQKLLRDEGSNNPISVIPIVGMGGIGKTALAQLVYHDSEIQNCFDIKVWVCVSENFHVIDLTRTILRNVARGTHDLNNLDLNLLQETLKEKLSHKKFLLILDDVWEEDYNLWAELRKPFISAASSSKIVVTTRKKNAAPITGDVHVYPVKELPNDECLCLLAFHAFGAANGFEARPDLKDIGEELVKRCNGIPLAATVLGGLLSNKRRREQWERVLRNKWWKSTEPSNSVHLTLKLSYDDLPCHLKRCFVYCAIFPKDYEFRRDELVRLWMAEGFLHHPQGGELMEDLGIDYFDDLVSRSFFQWSSSNEFFVMHDLISDLAQTIAGDICYNYENKIEVDMKMYENVRHASFSFDEESQVYSGMKRLRTIWGRGEFNRDHGNKMLEELLAQSKCMRVLSLRYYPIKKLSNSIGDLIHLRYIDLSGASIQRLPESVSNLLTLQTLLLDYCMKLVELPDNIGKLANLLHLDISHTYGLQKLPSSIGMLTNLQTLPNFTVNEGDETAIAELKNLNHLRGSLSIEGLENVQDAESAILKGMQGLEELELKWSGGNRSNDDRRNDVAVLESLEPHQNLKRLTISRYGGAEFPSWMTNNHLFSKLVFLLLRRCKKTKVLPPLGQLCLLKELIIDGLKAVKSIGVELYGNAAVPFPSLERLRISRMSEWNEWSHGNMGGDRGFPNLQELRIYNCHKLIGSLPSGLHRLSHLSELEIEECGSLVSFPPMGLPCSLKRIGVRRCDALECFPIIDTRDGGESLLEELVISRCSALKYFERNFKLPTSLRFLTIKSCRNLLSLPDGLSVQDDNTNQSHLEHLISRKCPKLIGSLPSGLHRLRHLSELFIFGCGSLVSFPPMGLPCCLKRIEVRSCYALQCFPIIYTDDSEQSRLEELYIECCSSLTHFQRNFKFPNSLRILEIMDCENLLSLPDGLMVQDDNANQSQSQSQSQSHLEHLEIWGCQRLTAFTTGKFPAALKILEITECSLQLESPFSENNTALEKIVISENNNIKALPSIDCLPSLKELSISHCPALESFPEVGFHSNSLQNLVISYCQNLPLPPILMQSHFPSLRELKIRKCPNVASLVGAGGVPQNLTTLEIWYCENLSQPIAEWGLGRLSSLETLDVRGRCPATDVVLFPDDNCCCLPTSLKRLYMEGFRNLESVSMGLQRLTSLEQLIIVECCILRSLPKEALPCSLKEMYIRVCPLLKKDDFSEREGLSVQY